MTYSNHNYDVMFKLSRVFIFACKALMQNIQKLDHYMVCFEVVTVHNNCGLATLIGGGLVSYMLQYIVHR